MKKIACFLSFFVLSMANAAPIIDQNQAARTDIMAFFSQSDLAQSFQQSSDTIAGAGIFLTPTDRLESGRITISLWDKLPNDEGTLLGSGTSVGESGSWVDVFWTPEDVTPDTTLFLVFTSSNSGLGVEGDIANPYDRGEVYANSGFQAFPDFDYTFRTYKESSDKPAPVPEPASVLLLGLGVTGLALSRRRRAVNRA